jgi:hypothetical protein
MLFILAFELLICVSVATFEARYSTERSRFARETFPHSSIQPMPSMTQRILTLVFSGAIFSFAWVYLLFVCLTLTTYCNIWYLFQVFRMIYTGKSSALDGKRVAASASQAERHGMKKATSGTIAYAAMQVIYPFCQRN